MKASEFNPVKDILVFYKKPNLKIGQEIMEILADNGHHKYMKPAKVIKIKKEQNQYKVYLL